MRNPRPFAAPNFHPAPNLIYVIEFAARKWQAARNLEGRNEQPDLLLSETFSAGNRNGLQQNASDYCPAELNDTIHQKFL